MVGLVQGRIASVEGLRGLAFLVVHMFHTRYFGPATGTFHLGWVYALVTGQGWIGVDLFFVLSGFLITGTIFRGMEDRNWVGRFYLRRALRIMPLYFMVLLGTLFLVPLCFGWTEPLVAAPRANIAWYLTFTHNWLNLKGNGWPGGDALIGQLWSLAVEEQFYLVWPLAVAVLARRWLGTLALGILLAVPLIRFLMICDGWKYEAIYASTICRADTLAAGAMVAILASKNRLPSPRTAWAIALAGMVLFFASSQLIQHFGSGTRVLQLQNASFTWSLAMWAGFLIVALKRGPLASLLSFKPLRFVGFYSYTLYLVSYPTCFIAGTYWKRTFGETSTAGHFLFMGSTFAVCLLISVASWHLVEKRFLSFRGKAPVFR
ncbi:MAG TPA: acyltransferase [Fibrobacteria bacterium]|nr:acyltransferase [Fibrobacteria bacterium]